MNMDIKAFLNIFHTILSRVYYNVCLNKTAAYLKQVNYIIPSKSFKYYFIEASKYVHLIQLSIIFYTLHHP